MAVYAGIQPIWTNVTRYRKYNAYYEIYSLIRNIVDDALGEEEGHKIAESAACWCETHFVGETYEHELFTIELVED